MLKSGGHVHELSGYEPHTTNNRMELTAAIEALAALKRPCQVDLYTDSQYLRKGMTEWLPAWVRRGWVRANGSPVENVDLWQALVELVERHAVRWHWLPGHRGHRWNERADALASEARRTRGRVRSTRPQPGLQHAPSTSRGASGPQEAPAQRAPTRPARAKASPELPRYELYCRASVLASGSGPGGYAAVLVSEDGQVQQRTGGWPLATSNQMELWAVIAGLQMLPERSRVTVHTASKYVLEGATRWLAGWERNNWRTASGRPVANRELWQELSLVMGDHDVHWQYLAADEDAGYAALAAELARNEGERQRAASLES